MNIFFRTDSSTQIGTGHVARCLTLAELFQKNGANCRFICREHEGNLIEQIQQCNFLVSVLPAGVNKNISCTTANNRSSDYKSWLGVDWETDAELTKSIIKNNAVDWLIVDHYALDAAWEKELQSFCTKLMVIDDLADRKHDCDILLDQNLGRTKCDYKELVPDACTILAGPRYALIRDEFWRLQDKEKNYNKSHLNVLIFYGGIDAANYTGWTIELLNDIGLSNMHVEVVVGAQNSNIKQINSACENYGYTCHVQTDHMAEIMHRSDLYIGAGGGAILERIMMKLPSVTIAVAENQIEPLKYFSQTGASIYLAADESFSDEGFKQAILQALIDIKALTKNCEVLCEEFFSDRVHWLQKLLIKQSS